MLPGSAVRSTGRLRPRGAVAVPVLVAVALAASGAVAGPASARAAAADVRVPPTSTGQWQFGALGIADAWKSGNGARGDGVVVAVLDDGVDATAPELAGRIVTVQDGIGTASRVDKDPQTHGTGMAGLIAGQGRGRGRLTGVAPGARILPVNPATADFGRVLDWAWQHGARVVNMSVGSPGPCDSVSARLVRRGLERGMVFVASAGNEGASTPSQAPANCPGVLGVGATDRSGKIASLTTPGPNVVLAAPGVSIVRHVGSTVGTASGTSDATALVSGIVALVWSKHPELTNRQVVARLLATAEDVGPPGRDDRSGYGIVRPLRAITASLPADAPNPLYDPLDLDLTSANAAPPASSSPGTAPASPPAASPSPSSLAAAPAGRPEWMDSGPDALTIVLVGVFVVALGAGAVLLVLGLRRSRGGPGDDGPDAGRPVWPAVRPGARPPGWPPPHPPPPSPPSGHPPPGPPPGPGAPQGRAPGHPPA